MRWSAALLAAAAALILASPADAARLGGQKWPTRTITYHVAAPQYKGAVKAATRAWNRSGVKIRFKQDLTYWRAAVVVLVPHDKNVDALRDVLVQVLGQPQVVGGVEIWDVRYLPVHS